MRGQVKVLALIAQVIYQISESILHPQIDEYTKACNSSTLNFWFRQLGFVRIKSDAGFDSIRVILPEVLSLIATVVTVILCTVIPHIHHTQPAQEEAESHQSFHRSERSGILPLLKKSSEIIIVLFLGFVGSVQPCILNLVYFIAFLFTSIWWSSFTRIRRNFSNLGKLIIVAYVAVHICFLYVYQIPFIQLFIARNSFPARLIGFVPLIHTDCDSWWSIILISKDYWTAYVNIISIVLLYHVLILQHRWTYFGTKRCMILGSGGSSVHEEIFDMSDFTASSSNLQMDNDAIISEHTRKMLLAEEEREAHLNIPLPRVTSAMIDHYRIQSFILTSPWLPSITSKGLIIAISFLIHHFYIFALISMMVWALLYHSIFGLIFLCLACIFWVFKDSRTASFRFSPFIVVFASVLLTIQYICGLDIAEEWQKYELLELFGIAPAQNRTDAFIDLVIKS
ncbi:unnamed protein product [Dracunculus medinensis]|uniref:Piezo-type mechanosensitive ion channel component n=1 Tax=Dracunculus medinensis TaxID=318479 RepID=A0A0N4U6X7_DRAME|nr:unnamed protein product [Dracunculus medinensis]